MNDYDWILNWGVLYPTMLVLWVIVIGAIIYFVNMIAKELIKMWSE